MFTFNRGSRVWRMQSGTTLGKFEHVRNASWHTTHVFTTRSQDLLQSNYTYRWRRRRVLPGVACRTETPERLRARTKKSQSSFEYYSEKKKNDTRVRAPAGQVQSRDPAIFSTVITVVPDHGRLVRNAARIYLGRTGRSGGHRKTIFFREFAAPKRSVCFDATARKHRHRTRYDSRFGRSIAVRRFRFPLALARIV